MRWTCIALLSAAMAARVAHAEVAEERRKLVVMDLVSERGIDEGVVRLLNELLLTEFQRTKKYEVIGGSDLDAMLSHEQRKDLIGCADVSCMAQIGGSLGADLLAVTTIGRIGDFYLLNVKIINVRTAKVEDRWSAQVEGVENRLMEAIRESVASISGTKATAPEPKVEPVHAEAAPEEAKPNVAEKTEAELKQLAAEGREASAGNGLKKTATEPPPMVDRLEAERASKRTWGWVGLGATAALVGGGGLLFGLMPSEDDIQASGDMGSAIDRRNSMVYAGWAMLITGAVSAVFSVYEFATMPKLGQAAVTLAPAVGGATVLVVGHF